MGVVTAKFVNKHRTLSCLDLCVIQLNELQGCKWMSGILLQSVFHSGAVNYNLFLIQWRELQPVFHSVAVNYKTQWQHRGESGDDNVMISPLAYSTAMTKGKSWWCNVMEQEGVGQHVKVDVAGCGDLVVTKACVSLLSCQIIFRDRTLHSPCTLRHFLLHAAQLPPAASGELYG